MRTFFTTEEILTKILRSRDVNVWKQILMQQDYIVISTTNGNASWDLNNKTIYNYHRKRGNILVYNEFFKGLDNHEEWRLGKLSAPILLLDIKPKKAKEIRTKYGVCCYSIKEEGKPFITNKGWNIETNDDDKFNIKSWTSFYDGIDRTSNSILIVDRYLFKSEWNKKNGDPDDYLIDSYNNILDILENLLPQNLENNFINITIIFSDLFITGGKNDFNTYTFSDVVGGVEKNVRSQIKRPYMVNIELISINSSCKYFNDTHDRFIITNYSVASVPHKIKAFNNGIAITKQTLNFDYSYSRGIAANDKSSIPAKTQERVIASLKNLLYDTNNIPHIKQAKNITITPTPTQTPISIENRFFTAKF